VATVGMHGWCLAGENGAPTGPGKILGALADSAVPATELGQQHARGSTSYTANFTFDGSLSDGTVAGNTAIGNTGAITNTDSSAHNPGIMTVSQNTGATSFSKKTPWIVIREK